MRKLHLVFAALLALAVSATLPSSAFADWYFDATINEWVDSDAPKVSGRRGGSKIKRKEVDYPTKYKKGTIIVETSERRLYLVLGNGRAMKYGVGVGRDGFRWSGTHRITRKAEWPSWTPPPAMRKRVPGLPQFMPGGPNNPMGARALYIGNTMFRLHGTVEPWTIGTAISSGCIRLTNPDIIDLYNRAKVGARIIVRH